MAQNTTLKARPREERGKGGARQLRRQGRIPAVVYGRGEETRAVSVDAHELERLFSHISVENTLIDLRIEGRRGAVKALVREVQTHPFRPDVLHVDFFQIHADEPVDVEIPVRLTGTAEGVKEGGVLQHVLHELPIRCLPAAIPEVIVVDVSGRAIGESVHVGDLVLPEGVSAEIDAERTVCSVVPPMVEVVEEEVEEEELEEAVAEGEEPELIRKRAEEAEAEEEPAGGEEG
jgi:large subunit ribosomal protein L25